MNAKISLPASIGSAAPESANWAVQYARQKAISSTTSARLSSAVSFFKASMAFSYSPWSMSLWAVVRPSGELSKMMRMISLAGISVGPSFRSRLIAVAVMLMILPLRGFSLVLV
ncbi:MAG: hypothetical protein ABSG53_22295 [Thermoguttaceae bacterium]